MAHLQVFFFDEEARNRHASVAITPRVLASLVLGCRSLVVIYKPGVFATEQLQLLEKERSASRLSRRGAENSDESKGGAASEAGVASSEAADEANAATNAEALSGMQAPDDDDVRPSADWNPLARLRLRLC